MKKTQILSKNKTHLSKNVATIITNAVTIIKLKFIA